MKMENEQSKLFFSLFMLHQNRIRAYILMLVTNVADADDLMQETASVMWQKFGEFEPGTNFFGWGAKIALNKVMAYRKKMQRSRIHFNDEQFRKIIESASSTVNQTDSRIGHLQECLKKLPGKDIKLLKLHYEQKKTIKSIAEEAGRSIQGLYKVMARINSQLMECINWKLRTEDI